MTPDNHTISEFFLAVVDGHQLYVQDWGKKDAQTPILFLHGGPGSGCKDSYKTTFDPALQRVLFFDQRGSGRSLPYGTLEHNTSEKLVDDIEALRKKLALDKMIVTGGSWGCCLALLYGIKYPQHVSAMVLRGIFTATEAEHEWLERGRFSTFYPESWQALLDDTPAASRKDPYQYHVKRILGDDEAASKESAYVIGRLEASLLSLDDRYFPMPYDSEEYDRTFMRIETHYLANRCFIPADYILKNAHKLTMPVWLIQGRYDMVCPPEAAWKLHGELPNSQLVWTVAGHGNDRPNYDVHRSLLLQMAGE